MENNFQFVKCEQSNKIQLFDCIKNPLDKTMVKTLIRLYQDIPVFASYILNEILDRLEDDGRIKMTLKKDWPKLISLLQGYSKQAIQRYAEDEEKYNCNTVVGEINIFEKMLYEFNNYLSKNPELEKEIWYKDNEIFKRFEKFHKNFIKWAFKIESIANIENENSYMKEVADKATFLYRLQKGDQFSFVDNPSFHEFTFIETKELEGKEEADVVCYYRNIYNETQVFYESNIYRPVIITKNIFE